MKILYIGQLNEGGTCLDRSKGLVRAGFEVVGFNVLPYNSKWRIISSLQHRTKLKFLLRKLNSSILSFSKQIDAVDVVWVDKGIYIFPETIRDLKKHFGCRAVHYTPDPQILFHASRHVMGSIPYYDLMVTTKSFEVALYQAAGVKKLFLSQQGFCPIRYADPRQDERFSADVGFVGHFETHYARVISFLADNGIACRVWGKGWDAAKKRGKVSANVQTGPGVWGGDYIRALATFKIGLGLISKLIPELHTTRSFEIPACMTLLLAERTSEHLGFFEEGREAEFFSTDDELLDKVRFYLKNESARRAIAEAGRRRCMESGYDIDSLLRGVVKNIESLD